MPKKKKHSGSDEEEDILYYRYSSASAPSSNLTRTLKAHSGSGGLAPSKSTLYVSNIDFSLTNSDLNTLFSTFRKIARVTVVKDRVTSQSRGVSFIQYVSRDDAQKAAREMSSKILNDRTLTASIAAGNGRAPEFIKKRVIWIRVGVMSVGKEDICLMSAPGFNWGPGSFRFPSANDVVVGGGFGGRYRLTEEDDDGSDGGIGLRMIVGLLLWIIGRMKGC